MEEAAKLITAIAALVGALAWPAAFSIIVLAYRKELRTTLSRIPSIIDRMKALKLGAIETELEKVADSSVIDPAAGGRVSVAEVEATAKIAVDSSIVGGPALTALLERLCAEYDTIRKVMPAGHRRTAAMTRVLVQMRSLGPSLSHNIQSYKTSTSPGGRLAAVAMMQMDPHLADLNWLLGRFRVEQPFIFYHAALAMQNAAVDASADRHHEVKDAARQAIQIVKSFDGEPDASTLEVLEALVTDQPSGHYS